MEFVIASSFIEVPVLTRIQSTWYMFKVCTSYYWSSEFHYVYLQVAYSSKHEHDPQNANIYVRHDPLINANNNTITNRNQSDRHTEHFKSENCLYVYGMFYLYRLFLFLYFLGLAVLLKRLWAIVCNSILCICCSKLSNHIPENNQGLNI